MTPHIGITEKNMVSSVHLLTHILADEVTLYTKTRKFHWNVSGQSFMELHKLFQAQYTELEEVIDEVAERINKLGGKTIGSLREFVELTSIKESTTIPLQKEMLKELLADHQMVAIELRRNITTCANENNDAGSADFLTGLLQQHETIAWVLRRYLV